MTKKYSTKRALVASILALCMCFTMLVGTTFAWFTDSVTSSGNVIQTGKLDVAMYWAEGDEDPTAVSDWNDANGAIFNNDKWEPGYAEAKHIKIANEGTLALKYQMRILANGVVSELADVIDVYYFDEAQQLTHANFVDAYKLGTLTEVLNVEYAKNISNTVSGNLEAGTSKTVTLAFMMQEDAGNEYQNLSIGADFSIQILATQYTSEEDSFNNQYDGGADFAPEEIPAANVYALSQSKLQSIKIGGFDGATLDTGYSFQPTETYEQALKSEYSGAHADFFVYADRCVPANSMALAGYYTAFDGYSWGGVTCTSTNWIGMSSGTDVKAGEANGVRLIGGSMGLSIAYNEICNYGNDGTGFLCGAANLNDINVGTTLTVELRLYKTYDMGTCPGGSACVNNCCTEGNCGSANCETGEFITVGKFEYTFGGEYVTLSDGSVAFATDDGEIWLRSVEDVEVVNGTYYVPDGVTAIGRANGDYMKSISWEVFSSNPEIKTVVFSDTVREIGPQAHKGSAVETVVLNEGLVSVSDYAFNSAKNLKNIEFSSTVTTIEQNAFSQIAATEITIPATVTTIGYAAFTSSPNLATVTVEGDCAIENYAFRGCGALRTVYLNGENVTIGTNMAFANASSNNPGTNNITFYVKNEAVAAQVRASMQTGTYFEIIVPTQHTVQGVDVVMSEQTHDSIQYYTNANYSDKISAMTLYTKADLEAALKLAEESVFVYNRQNDIHPVINFAADIDFGGGDFVGFGEKYDVNGNEHTLSNINFVANAGGKAGLINYAGDNIITGLTIKNATSTGAQAGIFCGNSANVKLVNCALEGNITVNWAQHATESYNGVGAVWGVIASDDRNSIECDTANANITINKDGITYAAGKTAEGNDLVGVVYGGSYVLVINDIVYDVVKVSNVTELQNALDNATGNTVINFVSNITGDVTVVQKNGINLIIDGCNYEYSGQIDVNGNGNLTSTETLTFCNINFTTDEADNEFIYSPSKIGSKYSYPHNITVDSCTFTATDAAIHTASSIDLTGANNITVVNCEATNMYYLLRSESCGGTAYVENCKVINGKHGVSFNNTKNAVIKNCQIEATSAAGYGIRHQGAVKDYSLTVENCEISAFVPVLIRKMTSTGHTTTFNGENTLTANNSYGYQIVFTADDWEADGALPAAPTGTYTLTGADEFEIYPEE